MMNIVIMYCKHELKTINSTMDDARYSVSLNEGNGPDLICPN